MGCPSGTPRRESAAQERALVEFDIWVMAYCLSVDGHCGGWGGHLKAGKRNTNT